MFLPIDLPLQPKIQLFGERFLPPKSKTTVYVTDTLKIGWFARRQTLVNSYAVTCIVRPAETHISGMGSATVWVDKELDASISGAGSVNYYGGPSVQEQISGAGDVKGLGEK
jgi:hypothetical protein